MLFFETKINNSNKTAIVGVIFLSEKIRKFYIMNKKRKK